MSRGPIHVLNFFRPREPPLRVSLHSASAWAPFRPIEMCRQRRVRAAVVALAWNAAHSHWIWRHEEVAPLGFERGPVPMALTGRLQEIRLPRGTPGVAWEVRAERRGTHLACGLHLFHLLVCSAQDGVSEVF